MINLRMRMLGKIFTNRGQLEWSCRLVSLEVFDMPTNEDDDTIDLIQYPYVGINWLGCVDILFTQKDLAYAIGTLCYDYVFFILIFHLTYLI